MTSYFRYFLKFYHKRNKKLSRNVEYLEYHFKRNYSKNVSFGPCEYKKVGFSPWYFVLVLVKLIHIGFGPCNM